MRDGAHPEVDPRLSTLTHARLRAAQGDLEGARRIVLAVLGRTPDDEEARALAARFVAPVPRRSKRGRVVLLEDWLERIRRRRERERAR